MLSLQEKSALLCKVNNCCANFATLGEGLKSKCSGWALEIKAILANTRRVHSHYFWKCWWRTISLAVIFSHLISIILNCRGSVKDKWFHNMKYNLFLHPSWVKKTEKNWSQVRKMKMSVVERHLEHLLRSPPQNRSLCVIPPHGQVRGHTRRQEEGAGDVASEGSSAAPPAIAPDKTRARIEELPLHPGSTGEY